jgi:hypothetical protein
MDFDSLQIEWDRLIAIDQPNQRDERAEEKRRRENSARKEIRRQQHQNRLEINQQQIMADQPLVRILQDMLDERAEGRLARNALGARTQRENNIRAQVQRIDVSDGEDKPKMRRWLRDMDQSHATNPAVTIDIVLRTTRGALADAIETYSVANPPRNAIQWIPLRQALEQALLGDGYDRVLRHEIMDKKQRPHETLTEYSEWFLKLAKDA